MAMVETTLSISHVMETFQGAFDTTIIRMSAYAYHLLGIIALIDLVWSVLSNLDEQDHLKNLILRMMKYGFLLWVILEYDYLLDHLIDGFFTAGLYAGESAGVDSSSVKGYLTNPNQLIDFGFYVAKTNFEYSSKTAAALAQAMGTGTHSTVSWHDVIAFLTISGYFVMALQVFLTYLEFYILGGLALLIVPFGAFPRTSHLAEKVLTLVICFGVKLMVIAFILSILDPLFRGFVPPGLGDPKYIPTVPESLQYLSGTLVICILMWHAPNLAASLLSGALSMNAGGSVSQMRGFTYGMGAGMRSGGSGAQGAGAGGSLANVRAASDVGATAAGGNLNTGSGPGLAQSTVNLGNAYFADMAKIRDGGQSNNTPKQGSTGDKSAGGVEAAAGGGSNTVVTASQAGQRIASQAPTSTSEAAATKENKPS